MKIDKLLKRFMKAAGVYGSSVAKDSLIFLDDYDEAMLPFNSFRWDTTNEGHNYWYEKTMEWVLYLYDNFENIDDEDKTKYDITERNIKVILFELMEFFCLDNASEEELMKIDAYKRVSELHEKLREKYEPKIVNAYTYDGTWSATTTVSYTTA
jgi:hypothetical protein